MASSINWVGFIFVSLITKPLTKTALGINGTFALFGGSCLLITAYCAVFLIETRGRSRKEVIFQYARVFDKETVNQ